MSLIPRGLTVCAWLLVAAAATAQAPTPTPVPGSGSVDERIQRLEKLLNDTRAEIAALKAASAGGATDAKLAEIQRRIDILAQEIEAMKMGEAAQGTAAAPPTGETAAGVLAPPAGSEASAASAIAQRMTAQETAQRFGLGLSAAKVYNRQSGVSIGGYGEVTYNHFATSNQSGEPSGGEDQTTVARAVVYLGYKFDRHFVLNTEIEYENAVVASDKGGEAEVEFAYIDYMNSRAFNARAGLMLIPMGLVNEQHEPTAFLGVRRPDVEDVIIPSTWREIGFGVYGEAGPFTYRGYMVNGLNAAGYSADEGIHEGSQEGSNALAENWAFTGRFDFVGVPGLTVGASLFTGNSGQGRFTPSGQKISGLTTVVDAHADWRWRGLWLRGLYAHTTIDDAALINQLNNFEGDESIGKTQYGWYLQGALDLLSICSGNSKAALLPFVRYEEYDTQHEVPAGYERNPENHIHELTLGLSYYPISRLVLKADWQQRHNAAQTGVNQFNVGLGYIF